MSTDKKMIELEAIQLTENDLSLSPDRFYVNGEERQLFAGWVWGVLQDDPTPNRPPIHYLREFDGNSIHPNGGFIRLAETPVQKHQGLEHCFEMHRGDKDVSYVKCENESEYSYEIKAQDPYMLYQFSPHKVHMAEADFIDVEYELMPYALAVYECGALKAGYMHQHAIIRGTYEGKPIHYLGGFDRMYGGWNFGQLMFTGMTFMGIHEDGTREWGFMGLIGKDRGMAFYCKDGEMPIATTELSVDAEFVPLEYTDDTTMVFRKAVFKFAGKEIHYQAKWGYRGQTYEPETQPGMCQSSGVWYEGKEPVTFKESFVYAETHNALEKNVRMNGFAVGNTV